MDPLKRRLDAFRRILNQRDELLTSCSDTHVTPRRRQAEEKGTLSSKLALNPTHMHNGAFGIL
jgi:hypothetical protein